MALSPDLLPASSDLLCVEHIDDHAPWDQNAGADGHAGVDEWVLPSAAGDADDGRLAALLASESDHVPGLDYLCSLDSRALGATARHDAIKWILKVNEFYRFGPATAYLSVNYLDRFLSCRSLPNGNGDGRWPIQLLSVACVSVAAKMEETRVPPLLSLQILDPIFVFEPRTVYRMELLLMLALRWRMRSVTPFDFMPHLTGAFCFACGISSGDLGPLLASASRLILSTHRVVDFLGYRPSAIAAAAVLCAADEIGVALPGDRGDLLSCYPDWVNKEVVSRCRQLMDQYLIDTCPSAGAGCLKLSTASRSPPPSNAPPSPVGVLDAAACASCDSSAFRWPSEEASETEPPRPAKRRRLGQQRCTDSIEDDDIAAATAATPTATATAVDDNY